MHISGTHYGHVIRQMQSRLPNGLDGADRDRVVITENSVGQRLEA